jgi:hypothetical protein
VANSAAPTLHFSVVDVFGQTVNVTVRRWNDKVLKYRPHFRGQEQLVKDAISNPEAVYEGNTPEHKRFKGHAIPGPGFHFGGQSIVVVVWYPQGGDGVLTTTYSTPSSALQGKLLWPGS